jgi:tRNA G46 methylase TrmB
MKNWQSQIPKPQKTKHKKRCYAVWRFLSSWSRLKTGGKIVWLTDKEVTFYKIKYPEIVLEEIIEKDKLEYYKRYTDQKID